MTPAARGGRALKGAAFAFGPLAALALMLLGHDVGNAVLPPTVLPPTLAWVLAGLAVVAMSWLVRWLVVRAWFAALGAPARERGLTLALLAEIIEASDAPIFAKDLEGRYVAMNPAAGALLNVDPKHALGRRAKEIFAHELAERVERLDRRILERGETESFEEEFDTAQGRRLFRTTKGPLRDGGRVVGVYGITRDITAWRRQEEELSRMQTAVDQSPESIVVTDLDARIVYVNTAAEAISGYRRDELLGRNSRLLQSGRTPRATYTALWTALGRGQPWHGLFFNRRKDGTEYTEEVTITPLRFSYGRVTHYLAIKKDVTEQHRMAAELERYRTDLEDLVAERTAELEQARHAAEAANEDKSAFLATVSHELRTPMNGVVGLAEVLARSDLNPYQSDLVRTMRESSFGLLALIDDLLDLSKIEAGRLDLERTPVDLRDLVEGACDALQPGAAARGVWLQVFVDPALPAQVLLDAVRFRQIVDNLASNAIKFSGGLERAGCVRIRLDGIDGDRGAQLRLQVADNGIGMSAETIARIFEPYAQADASTTRRYGGTGLGMPIVQRLTQAFGGSVDVRSVPGEGSTVGVCIPLTPAQTGSVVGAGVSLRGLRALVCADDPQLGSDWAAYLAAAGAEVEHWSDPHKLRTALAAHPGEARVAVVGVDWAASLANEMRSAAQLGSAGLVLVGRGQRRRPRRAHGGEVVLDGDALHRAALVDAVALAAGRIECSSTRTAAAEAADGEPAEPESALPPPLPAGTRVLVAEDNPINQEVIRRQLALLGVEVDVADDGEAALARWRGGGYGLLLTDLRMPGVDGYELARRLRAEEGAGRRMPIIALTAAALYGEAERCRGAGMDDYTTKPLTLQRLAALLRHWLPQGVPDADTGTETGTEIGAAPATPGAAASPSQPPVYDPQVLAAAVGEDPELQDRVRRTFALAADQDAAALRAALAAARHDEVEALAHRLKGAAASVGALALAALTAGIETAARMLDEAALAEAAAGFDAALAAVLQRLAAQATQASGRTPSEHMDGALTPTSLIVVDDDPFQREVLRSQLAAAVRVPVVTLDGAAAALAAIEAVQVSAQGDTSRMMLLLDLRMPQTDGIELLRRLADSGYRGAVALMSAAGERVLESAVRLAAELGLRPVGHVGKPASTEALHALVQRWQKRLPAPRIAVPRRRSVSELEQALANHEFVLHYQPKVSLADASLVGVEALVRWRHPRDGLVYPDAFIGPAEEHGLIDALTDEVLSLALGDARQWRELGLAPRVAVNVSMDNLRRLDFPERVLARLAEHALAPADLLLEVTESRLMSDARAAFDILTRLRLHGVALAIDDFGTGHSSLVQLRDLPFDELKIDRGFVRRCGELASHRTIVRASAAMATQLGMRSVAEGVEDHADWEAARAAGCDIAQGYYVAKPMAGELLPLWAQSLAWRFAAGRGTSGTHEAADADADATRHAA